MDVEMQFAWIPPGMFLMGGNGQSDNPQHRVTISKGFWMGTFPVTQAQWQGVMGYNPSQFRGDDHPVEMVSWSDCQEFGQKMTELTGKPIRLPTEVEWEYACRAGSTGEYWNGNGVQSLKKVGWFDETATSRRSRSENSRPTRGVSSTFTAMCGSGARIGTVSSPPTIKVIRQDRQMETIMSCVGVAGTTMRPTPCPRTVAGGRRERATSVAGSASVSTWTAD